MSQEFDLTQIWKRTKPEQFIAAFGEHSKNEYRMPLPDDVEIEAVETIGIETHEGKYLGAIDILVPLGTEIVAARGGIVVQIVDSHDEHGLGKELIDKLNYITIEHETDDGKIEYTQYAHLAKGSSRVQVGQPVFEGETIAVTGESGMMDKPHLHFIVFRIFKQKGEWTFKGLIPRFVKE